MKAKRKTPTGEMVVVVGPTCSGKTRLLFELCKWHEGYCKKGKLEEKHSFRDFHERMNSSRLAFWQQVWELTAHEREPGIRRHIVDLFDLQLDFLLRKPIVIDLPESYLDPALQVFAAGFLVRLVRAGHYVLIATQSDFICKELNNRLMLSQLEEGFDKKAVMRDHGYSFVDKILPSMFRAYTTEFDGATQCPTGRFGFDVPFLSKAVDSINRTTDALSSRMPPATELMDSDYE